MDTLESIIAQLVAQGYSPEEARRRAESVMVLGASPAEAVFGSPPAMTDRPAPAPKPAGRPVPRSQQEYDQMMDAYNKGEGLLPMDGYETEAEVRQRYDSRLGRGAYGQYLMEKEARGEITIDPQTGEPKRIGGYFAKPSSPAQNVDDNLQAAATPIAMEPMAGMKPAPAASAMDPNDPSTWDAGYEDYVRQNTPAEPTNSVERVDRYFADKKRAPLQSREEFVGALSQDYNRRRGERDLETYGFGLDRTPEQQAAVDERAAIQRRAANTGRADEVRIARLAEQTGLTYAEAKERYLAAKSNLSPNDGLAPDGLMTPEGIRLATEELRGLARDKRNATQSELRAKNQRRGMLAGSNLRANNANAVALMSDDDVADVMRARSLPPGVAEAEAKGGVEAGKLDIANKEADARMAAIEAGIENTRADSQRRDREFQESKQRWEDERLDRNAQREQEALDRQAARTGHLADIEAANQKFFAEIKANAELNAARQKTADEANAINRMEAEARIGALDTKVQQQQDAAKRAEELLRRQTLTAQYGPGVEDLLTQPGSLTPAAEDTLRKIATEADQNYFGFWQSDAERMNAILQRIGIADPSQRKVFVETFGLAPDSEAALGPWGGTGRGARMSYWFSPRPKSY